MQTRCLSCGKTIDGIAQFCDVCQEQQPLAVPAPIDREVPTVAGQLAPGSFAITAGFFAIVGCCLAAAAVWLLAFGGAGKVGLRSQDSSSVQALPPSVTRGPTASPGPLGLEHAPCKFSVPAGQDADCGYLTVPESRMHADGPTVRLPVVVLKSSSANKRSDPIVYLDGGPGADTVKELPGLFQVLKPLLQDRDLIVFDQRGAGSTEPSLDCPELTQLNYDHLEQHLTVAQRVAQDAASVKACHDRLLSKGIDPALATSAESAADVNDLRLALGYNQWDLYGVSYGTKLALTVMRDFPDGVRSVILDSVYPLQSDLYTELPANFDRALRVMFEKCAADAACNSSYPNLEKAFYDTVDRLNERPVTVTLGTIVERPIEGAVIDGVWFAEFIFQSLYSKPLIPLLPKAIFDTRDKNYYLLTILAEGYLQDARFLSLGMYFSVQCGEELPFSTREAALAAADADPRLSGYNEYSAQSIYASCDIWQAQTAGDKENKAVDSSIPTLVLSGEFDPITPPAWGRLVAQTLSNSFYFEFPGVGHGVAFSDECPLGIAQDFFDEPQSQPASNCIDRMSEPRWIVN